MTEDIAPSLLKKIQEDFQEQFDKSEVIIGLYAKVRDGTATYVEANEFAIKVGEILANAYQKNISSSVLPDGKMYYNIGKRVVEPTMVHNYDLIAEVTRKIQALLNKKAGIGIKPIIPELNWDRIRGIIERAVGTEKFDDVRWILDEPVKNFSQSIVDDFIRENAEFQYDAGMSPKIIRKLAGGCCEWCRAVAGVYKYPKVPKDIYRRHQRCRCTVEYDPGDGKVQNVHTKKYKPREISHDLDYMGQAKIYEAELGGKSYAIKTYKNDNYQNIWCQTYSNDSQRMCEYLNDVVNNKYPGVKQIVVAKKATLQGIAAYDHKTNTFFICEELIDEKRFSSIVDGSFFAAQSIDDILIHELGGHKKHWEAVERYYKLNKCNSLDHAKNSLEAELREYITRQMNIDYLYLKKNVSNNAFGQFLNKNILNESIADAIVLIENGSLRDENLERLVKEVIFYDGNAK